MCNKVLWTTLILVVSIVRCENACEIYLEISPDRMITLVNQDEMCSCFKYKKSADASSETAAKSCDIKMANLKGKMAFSADSLCACAGFEVHPTHKFTGDTATSTVDSMHSKENKTALIHNDTLAETTATLYSDVIPKTLNTTTVVEDILYTPKKIEITTTTEKEVRFEERLNMSTIHDVPGTVSKSKEVFTIVTTKAIVPETSSPESDITETKIHGNSTIADKIEIIDHPENSSAEFVFLNRETRSNSSTVHDISSYLPSDKINKEFTTIATTVGTKEEIAPRTSTDTKEIIPEHKTTVKESNPVTDLNKSATTFKISESARSNITDTIMTALFGLENKTEPVTLKYKYTSFKYDTTTKMTTNIPTVMTSANRSSETTHTTLFTGEFMDSNSSSLKITDSPPRKNITTPKNDYLIVATVKKHETEPYNITFSTKTSRTDEAIEETRDDSIIKVFEVIRNLSDTTLNDDSSEIKERNSRSSYTTELYNSTTSLLYGESSSESDIYFNYTNHTHAMYTTPRVNLTYPGMETSPSSSLDDEYYDYNSDLYGIHSDDASSSTTPNASSGSLDSGVIDKNENLSDSSNLAVDSKSIMNIALFIILCICLIVIVAIIVKLVKCYVNRGSYALPHHTERNIEMDTKT